MRLITDPRLKTWFVGFSDETTSSHSLWYESLLAKGFKHCYAFAWDEKAAVWILYDPGWESICVRAMTMERAERFFTEIKGRDIILECTVKSEPGFYSRIFHTCATAVAYLVGVNIFFPPSVYALYCALRKTDAKVSFLSRPLDKEY